MIVGTGKGAKLDIQEIIADLKNERERLDRAIAALERTDSRPRASKSRTLTRPRPSSDTQLVSANTKTRGGITDERRKRLSESMKKSWAERRKKA
jgi:hypothetical protein